jgi:hypothetical protein
MLEPQWTPPGSPCWVRLHAAPFPPPGPPGRVPRLRWYYDAVRLPGSLAPRFVAFAWRYLVVCLSLRSRRSSHQTAGLGFIIPVPTAGTLHQETFRASQSSWRIHMCLCPALRPRQDRPVRPYDEVGTAPVLTTTKAPTTKKLSRLNHTALALTVYASSGASRHATQDSFPAAGRSTGREWLPAGFLQKVSD